MNTFKNLFLLSCVALCASFTPPAEPPVTPAGTYGVCGCAGQQTDLPSLTLNQDNSYRYSDGTDQGKMEGEWRVNDRKVTLFTKDGSVYQRWNLDKDTPCIRTRKGLLFTRLCRLAECDG